MTISDNYTGADLIADFIADLCNETAYLVIGGACAFIVDAIGRNPKSNFVCFQHEQSAAMAADAVWRTSGRVGVTVTTSGPGATNLITGIACSWFDSIPTIHITGQVNDSESREALNANVRQAGFQETDIVSIVKSITKFAKKIESVDDLIVTLPLALKIALDGRMGPVLLDVPMNIQKAFIGPEQKRIALTPNVVISEESNFVDVSKMISSSARPVVLIGAGAAISGTAKVIQNWCEKFSIPYVTSWGAMSYLDRAGENYFGSIGVYGARPANWLIQAADQVIVFGSRLDNRQRTGNPNAFAPFAKICVFDIDQEELKKYRNYSNYEIHRYDLKNVSKLLLEPRSFKEWAISSREVTSKIAEGFNNSTPNGTFNPYSAVRIVQKKFKSRAIVTSDCGANLCWVYQSYLPDDSFLFTAGGNSPMGYSLPAAVGAQLTNPSREVYCFIGDGGLQMNLQELQTVVHYKLPIKIFIQNNFGYGIIKQFQDSNFNGRHYASGDGYSLPDFKKIAEAYDIPYTSIKNEKDLASFIIPSGYCIIDLHLPPESLITPKVETNRFLHDQFPYIEDGSIQQLPFAYPKHPSSLEIKK